MRQAAESLAYVAVPVAARVSGAWVNPTADTVRMAFPVSGSDPAVWYSASWMTDTSTTPPTYFAQCLVGPGGAVVLAEATYDVYVQVTDTPEVPVLLAGQLVIF